jgi:uncharacterized protein YjbJ (UPF0337 family)
MAFETYPQELASGRGQARDLQREKCGRSRVGTNQWRFAMNKDQVKGTGEKVKGKLNEAVGRATHDKAQETKGQVQQGAGEARKQYGDVKEDVKKHNS